MYELLEFIIPYIPYVVIILNAVIGCLTYRRTGKVTKINPQTKEEILDEDLLALIKYHEETAKSLKNKVVKK